MAFEIDPNVKLPLAVLAASKAAEELHKETYSADAPTTDEVTDPPPEAPAAPELPVTPEVKPPERNYENDFRAMKGRFDRAQSENNELRERIRALENAMRERQAQPEAPAATEKLITEQEEQDFGPEFLSVVGKKAREELMPLIKGYESKIAELQSQLQGVNGHLVMSDREKMHQQLGQIVPNWQQINTNEKFLDWVNLPDPYSGVIRHDLLISAYDRNDTARVANFFKGFLAEEAAVAPASGGTDSGVTTVPKVSLDTLAAPGRAKPAATSVPAEKPLITSASIAQFYTDVTRGKYAGRDELRAQKERDIFQAQREGRVR